jgi:hypothetical protein
MCPEVVEEEEIFGEEIMLRHGIPDSKDGDYSVPKKRSELDVLGSSGSEDTKLFALQLHKRLPLPVCIIDAQVDV